MNWHHMDWGWSGTLMTILWVTFILATIYWFISSARKDIKRERNSETPMDILKKRYARGDISKEEFEQIKKDLLE